MIHKFSCANCSSEIEQDSFFCDQCGREIFMCPECNTPRTGTFCEEHGAELISAKLFKKTGSGTDQQVDIQPIPDTRPGEQPSPHAGDSSSPPALQLISKDPVLCLIISPGDILGRTQGPFAGQLGSLRTLSGKHLQFHYKMEGWVVKDLGSTNTTKYAAVQHENWDSVKPMEPYADVLLTNNTYLRIPGNAHHRIPDIMFQVSIIGNDNPGKTLRTE